MRYFTCLLSPLVKSLLVIPLCLLGSSCPDKSEEREDRKNHPIWSEVNDSEDKLNEDHCIITKLGLSRLRFHVAKHQACFHAADCYPTSEKNILDTNKEQINWILTPNFYGCLTLEKFPKTSQIGMKSRAYDDQEGGIPPSFLEEWLAIDPIDYKEAILIVSTGVEGKLGVRELLKRNLKNKKEKGEIQDYKILRSKYAATYHNQCVKEGKRVFTFIHTGC
ncbi:MULTISPECIES: hypothetical protein [unclassified Candidatus Cardinium]|uniref:hypothetical protein n=1 Tax=unclassified Candidatus Cardinium TaxID=2641185 RepID=UPI001FB3E8BB|nr:MULTISPECIES: hypothetical protein [unclassified Candidatus Cardinium]